VPEVIYAQFSYRLIETNHFSLWICPQRLGKDESSTVPITVNWSCSLLTNSFKCANTVLYIPLSMRCVSLIHINPVPHPARPLSAVTSLKTRISTTDPRRRMRESSAQIQLGHLCAFPSDLRHSVLRWTQDRSAQKIFTNERDAALKCSVTELIQKFQFPEEPAGKCRRCPHPHYT